MKPNAAQRKRVTCSEPGNRIMMKAILAVAVLAMLTTPSFATTPPRAQGDPICFCRPGTRAGFKVLGQPGFSPDAVHAWGTH